MDRRAAWVLGIVFGGLFLTFFGFLFMLAIAFKSDGETSFASGSKVGVIEVMGPISDSKKTLEQIREFRDASGIKAVVVRVDSPGGAVGPSQEIFDALRDLGEKKPVVASMGSMAASGGYYIAAAAKKVYANPGTLTGSIGVIMQMPNVEGLMKWAGVEMRTITAGALKDAGSPFRNMTDAEREYFDNVLEDVHSQFIEAVAKGRGLKVEEVKPYADGRVFTGRQAKEWKLVDEVGGFNAAVADAGKLGGIEGEPELAYPEKKEPLLKQLLGEEAKSALGGITSGLVEQLGGAGLQYRLPPLQTR